MFVCACVCLSVCLSVCTYMLMGCVCVCGFYKVLRFPNDNDVSICVRVLDITCTNVHVRFLDNMYMYTKAAGFNVGLFSQSANYKSLPNISG